MNNIKAKLEELEKRIVNGNVIQNKFDYMTNLLNKDIREWQLILKNYTLSENIKLNIERQCDFIKEISQIFESIKKVELEFIAQELEILVGELGYDNKIISLIDKPLNIRIEIGKLLFNMVKCKNKDEKLNLVKQMINIIEVFNQKQDLERQKNIN